METQITALSRQEQLQTLSSAQQEIQSHKSEVDNASKNESQNGVHANQEDYMGVDSQSNQIQSEGGRVGENGKIKDNSTSREKQDGFVDIRDGGIGVENNEGLPVRAYGLVRHPLIILKYSTWNEISGKLLLHISIITFQSSFESLATMINSKILLYWLVV